MATPMTLNFDLEPVSPFPGSGLISDRQASQLYTPQKNKISLLSSPNPKVPEIISFVVGLCVINYSLAVSMLIKI